MRVPVSELIKIITRALAFHGVASGEEQSSHAYAAADPADLVRCFGMALGLLSMQMDLLDSLLGEVQASPAHPSEQFGQPSQAERQGELRRQLASFDDMVTQLWGALIAANTAAWLELACYPALGSQEEQVLRSECWLHAAVASAVGDAASGNLREELIPSDTSEKTGALLSKALQVSGLASKRLSNDGEVEEVPHGQSNQRLVHIIKICVGMALSAQHEQQ